MGDEKYQSETRKLLNKLKEYAYEEGITEQQISDKPVSSNQM
jgi:hypothetical protein